MHVQKIALVCALLGAIVAILIATREREYSDEQYLGIADQRVASLKSEYALESVRLKSVVTHVFATDRLYIYADSKGCEVHISVSKSGSADPAGITPACKKRRP